MKKGIIFIFLLFTTMFSQAQDTILYVFDPMCGWCYGFSDVIKKISNEYSPQANFEVISGGMVVGEREGPIGDFADYILGVYPRLEKMTGAKFGQPYLDQLKTKSIWTSSVIPSIAIEAFKSLKPEQSIAFASAVQHAYFYEGKDLREDTVYLNLAAQFGIDGPSFLKLIHSPEMKERAQNGYKLSASLGVSGYPAVLALKNGKWYALSRGYTGYEEMKAAMEALQKL